MPEQPASMPEILAPAPLEVPKADSSVPHERRRPNVFALGLLAVGFGLAIAAQYLPWGSFTLTGSRSMITDEELTGGVPAGGRTVEVPLTYLNTAHVSMYLLTLALALAGLAVVFTATGATRRVAAGISGGMLAANVLVLVGLKSVIDHMSNSDFSFLLVSTPNAKSGPGYLLAYSAVLVLAAALLLSLRSTPSGTALLGSRRRADEPDGAEPLELTVTSVPPAFR
ncbi:hypothetical protein [Dactylosporangium sp. CA-233914]|uniref:hypothetical protein n=1 Tax=Dactylosporangium sp. CA-233914 TaxID=3239934 RepID=UPI003D9101C8